MSAVAYIIVGAPRQSAIESVLDLVFLAQRRVLAGVSVFYPAPGSRDYALCATNDLLPDSFAQMRSTALPISHTTSRLESVTLLRLGRVLNFMKSLEERKKRLRFPNTAVVERRMEVGKRLLELFFMDGQIRGERPDGQLIEHKTADWLTKLFIERIGEVTIRGCL
jgi:hypothetical protein